MFIMKLSLYTNIDLTLLNKLHGPMHYKIGVTYVYNGHVFLFSDVKTGQFNPPISMHSQVAGKCSHAIHNLFM